MDNGGDCDFLEEKYWRWDKLAAKYLKISFQLQVIELKLRLSARPSFLN